jgi:hypothetical protein
MATLTRPAAMANLDENIASQHPQAGDHVHGLTGGQSDRLALRLLAAAQRAQARQQRSQREGPPDDRHQAKRRSHHEQDGGHGQIGEDRAGEPPSDVEGAADAVDVGRAEAGHLAGGDISRKVGTQLSRAADDQLLRPRGRD